LSLIRGNAHVNVVSAPIYLLEGNRSGGFESKLKHWFSVDGVSPGAVNEAITGDAEQFVPPLIEPRATCLPRAVHSWGELLERKHRHFRRAERPEGNRARKIATQMKVD